MNQPPSPPGGADPAGNQYPQFDGPPQDSPPPPPRKSRKRRWFLSALVLVVGAFFMVVGIRQWTRGVHELSGSDSSKNDFAVGHCLYFSSYSATDPTQTTLQARDCSDSSATYEVATNTSGTATCAANDQTYRQLDASNTATVQNTLCLVPDLREGQCYKHAGGGPLVAASCTESDNTVVKVAKRIDGRADASLCAEFPAGSAITFDKPARTYCAILASER
jgi:hypothetical protein